MFRPLAIQGLLIAARARHPDARGWFTETYRADLAAEAGLPAFVQENESFSARTGTVRGLHFQTLPYAQDKLVRCVRGAIFDVCVDLRPGSPTFARHVAVRISAEGGEQVFAPSGFAHGFCTLEPDTIVQYKTSRYYAPDHEAGLAWDDPALGIEWPVSPVEAVISDKDRNLPRLAELVAALGLSR